MGLLDFFQGGVPCLPLGCLVILFRIAVQVALVTVLASYTKVGTIVDHLSAATKE
jgi:hypothetical protein